MLSVLLWNFILALSLHNVYHNVICRIITENKPGFAVKFKMSGYTIAVDGVWLSKSPDATVFHLS